MLREDNPYRPQVVLLLDVLPLMAKERCFALKGGTAINLFVRDLPRLSVDIDLTYVPVQDRATSLAEAHGTSRDWDTPLLPLRYTEASCGTCHTGDRVPEASLLSAGRALMTQVGCFGCHKLAGHENWKSEAPVLDGLTEVFSFNPSSTGASLFQFS